MTVRARALDVTTEMVSSEATGHLYRVDVKYLRLGLRPSQIETLAAVVLCSRFCLFGPLVDTSSHITSLQLQAGEFVLAQSGTADFGWLLALRITLNR